MERTGRIETEVIAAAEGAELLVLARDGDCSHLGPHSLSHASHYIVDHAPCPVLLVWPVSPLSPSVPNGRHLRIGPLRRRTRRSAVAVGQNVSAPSAGAGDRAALQAVNFFMADMQAGIGPFLGSCCWVAGGRPAR